MVGAAQGLPARLAGMARPFWTPATPPATPAMMAEQALMRSAAGAAADNVVAGTGTMSQLGTLASQSAAADAAVAGAGQAGAMTPLGMVAAPVAGAVGGALAWKGINSLDIGGEGSTADRGLSGGAGGALAGAGLGATIGSIIPGAGTAAGAVVGGLIGGVAGALGNIFGGDTDKELKAKVAQAGTRVDTIFNDAVSKNDVADEIATSARREFTAQAAEIANMDVGADEKVELLNQLADAYTTELQTKYAGTGAQARAQYEQQQKDERVAMWQQAQQREFDTANAVALQSMIGQYMKPYTDRLAGTDPNMAGAYMLAAQAAPAYLAMQNQAKTLTARQVQFDQMRAEADYMNALANYQNAMNNGAGGGSQNAIDQLIGLGG
jgi:hypothetical protein